MDEFWKAIGDFFVGIWDGICAWFSKPDATGITGAGRFFLAIIVLIAGHYLIKLFLKLVRKGMGVSSKKFTPDQTVKSFVVSVVGFILRFILAIAVLLILNVDMSSATTVISSAILAIGLALQDAIYNFASGVMILSDKMYKAGDYVDIGGVASGTIKSVRLLNTVLTTPNNQVVIVPNGTITKSVNINYNANKTRRIDITIPISYQSDTKKAKKVLLAILVDHPNVLDIPSPTSFVKGFGDSGINMGVRGFCKVEDYWPTLFEINEIILKEFNKNSIEIPYSRYDVTILNNEKDKPVDNK